MMIFDSGLFFWGQSVQLITSYAHCVTGCS